MNSFSSASQICDPLPRTMNGASPPTAPNALTGEFTPPGIMLSARFCNRRDCSVLRDVMDGIESSRLGITRKKMSTDRTCASEYYSSAYKSNSSDVHPSAMALQHADSTLGSSSCPSNREGLMGQSRGLRTVLFHFCM